MEFLPKNICTTRFTLRSRVTALKRSPSTRNLENPNSGAFGSRFRFEDYAGKDPFGLVRSLNLSRRHLALAQKKEVAKHIFEREPGRSDNSIAKEIGLSHTTVTKMREEAGDSYCQNGNKNAEVAEDLGDDVPFSEEAFKPEPIKKRVEASGRKARGRKPLSPEEKARRANERLKAKWEARKETAPRPLTSARDDTVNMLCDVILSNIGSLPDIVQII